MASDYLCNLIIPGAAKSGTSSLHEYLGEHPMIAMSTNKEPHHFCKDIKYAQGAKAHNALFERKLGALYFGESSTGYLPFSPAAERIARDLDRPKAIIILRDPVARCFSHYRWRYRLGLERRSFLDAITHNGFDYNPEKPIEFGYMAYLEFSQYARQCTTWEDALGSENCLFLASDDLLTNRQKSMERCFAFLDVPPLAANEDTRKLNETNALGRRPPKYITRLASALPAGLRASSFYQKIRAGALKVTAPEPPTSMTPEERAFVEDSLAEDIAWYEARFGTPKKAAGNMIVDKVVPVD